MPAIIFAAAQPVTPTRDAFAGLERLFGHAAGQVLAAGLVILAAAGLLAFLAARYDEYDLGYDTGRYALYVAGVGGAVVALGLFLAAAPGPADFSPVWWVARWAAYAGIAAAVSILTGRSYLRYRRQRAGSWH